MFFQLGVALSLLTDFNLKQTKISSSQTWLLINGAQVSYYWSINFYWSKVRKGKHAWLKISFFPQIHCIFSFPPPLPPPTVPKLSFLWALKYSCSQNWHGGNKENVSTIVIRLVSNKYLWSIVNCTVCAYVLRGQGLFGKLKGRKGHGKFWN